MTHCSSNWLTGLRGMGGGVGEAGSSCLHTTGPLKSLREFGLLSFALPVAFLMN